MHFLICVGGDQYSRATLKFCTGLVEGLAIDLSILYVNPKLSYMVEKEVRLSQEKLEQWDIDTAEGKVLKGVEHILLEERYLRTVDGKADVRHLPKASVHGAFEYHLYGAQGQNVRIRVREGDVVDNIMRETMEIPYDLIIVGSPGDGGRLVHQIIQYVEPSVLIVKNPTLEKPRFLLCIDDSPGARNAEQFCERMASLLKINVDVLSIFSYPWEEKAARRVAERIDAKLQKAGIPHAIRTRRGAVVHTILREAQPEHIVILGSSSRWNLSQALFGSTPIKIGRKGRNPVVVVKQ
jgi:nucleotide-binding universal stress UspA family protein